MPTGEESYMAEEESEVDNNLANLFTSSPSSSDSTVINDTDSDSNDDEEPPVLKKQQPKHNWFAIPEVVNRQIGIISVFLRSYHKYVLHACFGFSVVIFKMSKYVMFKVLL